MKRPALEAVALDSLFVFGGSWKGQQLHSLSQKGHPVIETWLIA